MSPEIEYEAEIRLQNGTLALLRYKFEDDVVNTNQRRIYELFSREDTQNPMGRQIWDSSSNEVSRDTMPAWLVLPSEAAEKKLIETYKADKKPVPVTNNVTTFAVYRENGAMMGQFRSFVSPAGNPIGNPGMPSMHGGQIDAADFLPGDQATYADARVGATLREIREEFGVELNDQDINLLGDVYDADNRRFNHVHRVLVPYEAALRRCQ